ncbi:hypothetical protein BGZ63DRAFT_424350 [Mariannaea sp. PMI_226]|nr:hypothetical protein BGZ63DRAFT_424350 [Mariannaea sp. PMI_226]
MAFIEIDPDVMPKIKLGLHCGQIGLSFVLWCLEIAVFRGDKAKITGLNGWTFGVCFLSIPAWIYLVMTPRFSRTRKFAIPAAMLGVDAAFTIIWLSAFATQANYNGQGLCGNVCGISKAIVAFGVFITILFAGTTFLSGYTLMYYNFHDGSLPGYDNRKVRGGENIDPDKAAFSMAPHDDEAYERVNMDDHEGEGRQGYNDNSYTGSARYGEANPYSSEDVVGGQYGSVPQRQNSLFDHDTEYHSGGPAGSGYANPPVGTAYDDQPIQFPAANYDRTVPH